jgi:hypothetical protein
MQSISKFLEPPHLNASHVIPLFGRPGSATDLQLCKFLISKHSTEVALEFFFFLVPERTFLFFSKLLYKKIVLITLKITTKETI